MLLLGWNHRVPALLREFASYSEESFAIDIVSQVQAGKREKQTAEVLASSDRLRVRQLEFDYAVPADLKGMDPSRYDNVVLLSSERLKSGSESDARTILGYLLLRNMMPDDGAPPVLVELMDPDNAALFDDRSGEVIVSPFVVSLMLARVALRRELRAVFDELFTSGGAELLFRTLSDYDLDPGEYAFDDLRRRVDAAGEIAVGIRRAGKERAVDGGVRMNPGRGERLQMDAADELIVIATQG